jgi:hypothetical protein
MELEFFGNKLKLENNEIYRYKKHKNGNYWFKITFTLKNNGYLYCELKNNKVRRGFSFHRLIYLFYNLDFDIFNLELDIDHIDRNKLNNNIDNLRVGPHQKNTWNTDAKGCSFHKKSGKWKAYIVVSGKQIHLGYYDTEEEAHAKYLQAKEIHHII